MSTLDLLLKIDQSKMVRPTKKVEIPRLSKEAGDKVIFTLQALTHDEQEEISDISAGDGEIDQGALRAHTIIKGLVDPSLKSTELLKHFGAATPKDLLLKTNFLLTGEVAILYNEISELSGFSADAVTELKNE
ncbi:phage tail assembly chaperone [Paenibacillus humicus]|uniref:phage tail assembly chaperone n=1 Tax=Paenibacillus humicus TaxID=412861 RepID=UPI000FDA48F8|nr:XkdN-like protein [Paenibacillus humicus]